MGFKPGNLNSEGVIDEDSGESTEEIK